jgi:G3E family GTPase
MVTVVDAANLLRDYGSNEFLRDRGETAGEGDERTLVDLLVEQIEFADVVVINKAGDVSSQQLALVRKVVMALNADARLVETDFGKAPLAEILDTGLFDEERAQRHPLWYKELYSFGEHVPETEEYGIQSFVYRARRPFDPERFDAFINRTWPGLIRAKGHFWLATRPNWVGEFSLAGAIARVTAMGHWWAAIPRRHWPEHADWKRNLARNWDKVWGDRRQELVFIGTGLDEAAIRSALDGCLLGRAGATRFDPVAYAGLRDPFPAWGD